MRKVAFIPTREEKDRPIKTFLEKAGWEVYYIIKDSIFDAYTYAIKNCKANTPTTASTFSFDPKKYPGVELVDLR